MEDTVDDIGHAGDIVDHLWANLPADKRAALMDEINARDRLKNPDGPSRTAAITAAPVPDDHPARHTTITDIDDVGNMDFDY